MISGAPHKKYVGILILIALLILSSAGCSGDSDNNGGSNEDAATESDSSEGDGTNTCNEQEKPKCCPEEFGGEQESAVCKAGAWECPSGTTQIEASESCSGSGGG